MCMTDAKMIIDVHDGQSIIKPPACCYQKERGEYRYWFIYLRFKVLESVISLSFHYHYSRKICEKHSKKIWKVYEGYNVIRKVS